MAGPIILPSGQPKWPPTWGDGSPGCCCGPGPPCEICPGGTPSSVTVTISGATATSGLWYSPLNANGVTASYFNINGSYSLPLVVASNIDQNCYPNNGCHYEDSFVIATNGPATIYLNLSFRPRTFFGPITGNVISRQFGMSMFIVGPPSAAGVPEIRPSASPMPSNARYGCSVGDSSRLCLPNVPQPIECSLWFDTPPTRLFASNLITANCRPAMTFAKTRSAIGPIFPPLPPTQYEPFAADISNLTFSST